MQEHVKHRMTFDAFKALAQNSPDLLELIDGEVFLQASPSSAHQVVVSNLATAFGNYFKDKPCRHVVAPYDILLTNEQEGVAHSVQPDISVVCERSCMKEHGYEGVPTLVVEVLSPSTASKDFIKKMDLYMRFGVREYWIVSPKNKTIQVFSLENSVYGEPLEYAARATVISSVFAGLEVSLDGLFEW
jgi:Uma2 family endonuclease